MRNLAELQQAFQAHVLRGDTGILSSIIEQGGVDASARMAVYHNGYRYRLLDVLAEDYPKLHTLLGDQAFYECATAYIEARPSPYYNLRYFGESMSAFLTETAPYQASPVLAEMARFEWSLGQTLDAADAPLLTMAQLQAIAEKGWTDGDLRLHPSVQLQYFSWNVGHVWALIDEEKAQEQPECYEKPVPWVFWRQALVAQFISCTEAEAAVYQGIAENHRFSTICEALCEHLPEAEVPTFIVQCLSAGVHAERFADSTAQ